MAKQIAFDQEARSKILSGVSQLERAVAVTLGPKGRNVIIDKSWGSPTITKDGVTVAKEIELEDKYENMGAQMVREVASKTSDVAGDGTTTATVLAEAIYREGIRNVAAGSNPMAIKRGADKAVLAVVENLREQSIETRDHKKIAQVGTISANGDSVIGDLIADAMDKVGKDGVITVEEAKGIETTLDVVEGMQFDKGYLSPYNLLHRARRHRLGDDLLALLVLLAGVRLGDHGREQTLVRGAGFRVQPAGEIEHHVVGVELVAIRPFDVLAQMEGPGLEVIGGFPFLGKIGPRYIVRPSHAQILADLPGNIGFFGPVEFRRVGHLLNPHRDTQVPALLGCRGHRI